jgi:hypothetical protein
MAQVGGPGDFGKVGSFRQHPLVATPITMEGRDIPVSRDAEHVGVLRCTAPGSMASVLAQLSAHRRALFAVLPAGLDRTHHGNQVLITQSSSHGL